jgi:hypothetical protein
MAVVESTAPVGSAPRATISYQGVPPVVRIFVNVPSAGVVPGPVAMGPGFAGLKLLVPPPEAIDEVIVTLASPEIEDALTPTTVSAPAGVVQVPLAAVVVTEPPPAMGVTDKADEKGSPAFVPIKFNVPDQLPETVIVIKLLLLFGSGRTTQPVEFPRVQLTAVAVISPIEFCWAGFCAKQVEVTAKDNNKNVDFNSLENFISSPNPTADTPYDIHWVFLR